MPAAFTSRNCCAIIFAASVVGLMIAAAVAPWYKYTQSFDLQSSGTPGNSAGVALTSTSSNINQTQIYYDLNGFKTSSYVGGALRSSSFQNYGLNTSVRNTTKTSQAFVLMALIAGFILLVLLFTFFFDRIRNKLIFAIGMTVTRLIAVAFCALITISVLIAFLVYIGIVQSFKNDNASCVDGPCRSFVSSSSQTTTTTGGSVVQSLSWGPIDGWYITVCTTAPAVLLTLIVVINKFPLPIDSEASSGEAL